MSDTQTAYLKAWVGTVLAVLILIVITWLSSVILETRPVENAGDIAPIEENS